MTYRYTCLLFLVIALPTLGEDLTLEKADARLRHCYQLARETNDKQIVERVTKLRDDVKRNLDAKDLKLAEGALAEAEKLVGLDAGGKSMYGKPISILNKEQRNKLDKLDNELHTAMNKGDLKAIQNAVDQSKKILGDSAGLPDFRPRPELAKAKLLNEEEATKLFLKLVDSEPTITKTILSGKPPEGSMARGFASAVIALCEIRPLVQKHAKDRIEEVDKLIDGGCRCLLSIQAKDGFFYFPDLRGKHIRFGDMIEKLLEKNEKAVRDGWVVVPSPDGGSQFDVGEGGMALLIAGETLANKDWTKAGLLAADWTLTQTVVPNWNYNAFSVSLLSHAYRISKEKKYLEGALSKFKNGMLPGQLESGVWIDGHNARIVYHGILLRGCNDLRSVLPEKHEDFEIVQKANIRATKYLVETQKSGPFTTTHGLAELQRAPKVEDARAIEEKLASAIIGRCTPNGRLRVGAALTEIVALAKVGRE